MVGNDDRQTGTGLSASQTLDYLLEQNASTGSLFFEKIDTERLGIVGYSQGGAGAVRAVTEYDNGGMFKVLFTGSAAHIYLSQMWGGYDPAKVSIPWFMTAWMLYLLQNDTEAGQVFLGEDAEILHNANWQDVEKSR